ncbi:MULTISPECIES: hypothetical protein [Prochlorococcus]|uniref:Uncharacterized protein n=1 Tax=Prochlorococcus marinus (strain SARG / CCMP1375 / SS120) TaxID=167539 RepID=Q7V9S6_PROMA|nr:MULTISPECIES: hypothetical protein [Prochlorococcus]AAQ00795.1 Uncharacterized protein Pro_1751 [Prochlorococcus marinus subsp. marinus str. CCMP1375]KGG10711.1 hypothetical protein EV04_1671 [Prochlorococcus marinus str. LG]KGG21132.1 hypothetical protein EV08_0848 [Prochlorococcus marinus str. SS2]KGG23956.1 hypothetical protein EV09_0560 [Prochlorococcus marinus str. SS35]KGG31783.1 hypothetical protein EV10_1881 [Prochlorococcus marinus str. SS51]
MNAADHATNLWSIQALASTGSLLKNYFPVASINFSPWREDCSTKLWFEEDSLDLALHFPGWSPRLQCRSLLIQLRVVKDQPRELPRLLGVIMRGVTFDGERWRLATVGDWQPTGSHLPQQLVVMNQLHSICRDLFLLFPSE